MRLLSMCQPVTWHGADSTGSSTSDGELGSSMEGMKENTKSKNSFFPQVQSPPEGAWQERWRQKLAPTHPYHGRGALLYRQVLVQKKSCTWTITVSVDLITLWIDSQGVFLPPWSLWWWNGHMGWRKSRAVFQVCNVSASLTLSFGIFQDMDVWWHPTYIYLQVVHVLMHCIKLHFPAMWVMFSGNLLLTPFLEEPAKLSTTTMPGWQRWAGSGPEGSKGRDEEGISAHKPLFIAWASNHK